MFYFSQTRNLGIDTLSTACESSIMNSSFLFQILLVDTFIHLLFKHENSAEWKK